MEYKDFDDLGDKIQNIIDDAVNSHNYQKLNQSISQAVDTVIDVGSQTLKKTWEQASANIKKKETRPELYYKPSTEKANGIVTTVLGGVLSSGMGIGLFTTGILSLLGIGGNPMLATTGILAVGTFLGAAVLKKGISKLNKISRFKCYIQTLGNNTYCDFTKLARAVRRDEKFVKKDISEMLSRGWFLEGHVDKQETCLITSNETYANYLETQRQLEIRQKEAKAEVDISGNVTKEVQDVLDKGNEYLLRIRQSNDAIPGVEISAKISHMEMIVKRIFERTQEHPEVIPDLKRLMNYYLPTTVKLLEAYEDMDKQPVQGENIRNSKKEIENTLDTLNIAFEKLLDSIFSDAALDVSSDISVLKTVLAQEGLTEDDFSKMKKNSH